MVSQDLDVHIYSAFLVMSLLKISDAVYSFQCPVQSHWKHRAETNCGSNSSYFCLYDKNENILTEFCRENQDFEAPGKQLVVAGSTYGTLQGAVCNSDFYQPFKFLTSGNSRCVYKKSYCSEEGQVVYSNETEKNDRLCRCDYTRGYDFIIRPKHQCYCIPSEEDCSCHLKICSSNDILSPDYECLSTNDWKTSFTCQLIETLWFPGNSKIPPTVKPLFGSYATVNFEIEKYRKEKNVVVSSLILLVIMIIVGFCCLTSQCFSFRSINCFTGLGLVQIPIGDRRELDDNIATKMANEKTGIESKSVAIEDDKQELKDEIRKLDNVFVKVSSHVKDIFNVGIWQSLSSDIHPSMPNHLVQILPDYVLSSRVDSTIQKYKYGFNSWFHGCLSNIRIGKKLRK